MGLPLLPVARGSAVARWTSIGRFRLVLPLVCLRCRKPTPLRLSPLCCLRPAVRGSVCRWLLAAPLAWDRSCLWPPTDCVTACGPALRSALLPSWRSLAAAVRCHGRWPRAVAAAAAGGRRRCGSGCCWLAAAGGGLAAGTLPVAGIDIRISFSMSRRNGDLVARAERDRDAVGAGARGAADAVDVALRDVRQVEVDDVADAVDVDAAGGDVGRDQRLDPRRCGTSASTRSRWFCDLLPWIASAAMPPLLRPRTTLSAPCLVRVKTSARSTGSLRRMSASVLGFGAAVDDG